MPTSMVAAAAAAAPLLLLLLVVVAAAAPVRGVQFTGDAFRDFTDATLDMSTMRPHNFGVVKQPDAVPGEETACDGDVCPDVGVPDLCVEDVCPISGWDIRAVYFQYNEQTDELHIGIDCFGVCGDADGDGSESTSSATLVSLGGIDEADLAGTEGVAVALDFDLNVADVLPAAPDSPVDAPFDFIVGVPNGQPAGARAGADEGAGEVALLPCSTGANMAARLSAAACFGVYEYHRSTELVVGQRFLRPVLDAASGAPWPATNQNPTLSAARPDIEWTVGRVSELRQRVGADFRRSNLEPWTLLVQTFAGSFTDDGVGEDFVPTPTDYSEITFPCLALDECDVCFGDGTTCLDCTGVANGPAAYDACDVCGGDGTACADCAGAANGDATYDACGVCGGDGSACADCAGVPNGSATYDACDVCAGDGTSCADCAGAPNGAATYDACAVCGGDSSSCADCAGAPNGSAAYDACDVCDGDGTACADCAGVANGDAVYDACGVCGGNGDGCTDCAGAPNGSSSYDVCGVCDGDGTSCDDCAGAPNGSATYDACDVCDGDGTTCLDCAGTPFGTARFDSCGECDGDGSSCVCLNVHECATHEVDHALLEWTLVASVERIAHTVDVLEGIKHELCAYDVRRGALAADIAGFLDMAVDMKSVLDNVCYVQVWFKELITEASAML